MNSMLCSGLARSHPVTRLTNLEEAITEFASRAVEKLRRQGGVAGQVMTFIEASLHPDVGFADDASHAVKLGGD